MTHTYAQRRTRFAQMITGPLRPPTPGDVADTMTQALASFLNSAIAAGANVEVSCMAAAVAMQELAVANAADKRDAVMALVGELASVAVELAIHADVENIGASIVPVPSSQEVH